MPEQLKSARNILVGVVVIVLLALSGSAVLADDGTDKIPRPATATPTRTPLPTITPHPCTPVWGEVVRCGGNDNVARLERQGDMYRLYAQTGTIFRGPIIVDRVDPHTGLPQIAPDMGPGQRLNVSTFFEFTIRPDYGAYRFCSRYSTQREQSCDPRTHLDTGDYVVTLNPLEVWTDYQGNLVISQVTWLYARFHVP